MREGSWPPVKCTLDDFEKHYKMKIPGGVPGLIEKWRRQQEVFEDLVPRPMRTHVMIKARVWALNIETEVFTKPRTRGDLPVRVDAEPHQTFMVAGKATPVPSDEDWTAVNATVVGDATMRGGV